MLMIFEDPRSQQHFKAVCTAAKEMNAIPALCRRLDYLGNYACSDGEKVDTTRTQCRLCYDSAPLSFGFMMYRRKNLTDSVTGKTEIVYESWFTGGLIYSGPDQRLDGSFPAFCVGIGIDHSKPGWSVHT